MKKHRITAIILSMVMTAGLLAGCGGSGGDTEEAKTSEDGQPAGKIVVGGWPSGDEAFEAALEGFNEEYPDIEVEFQFTDTTSHHQALQTALAQYN